MKNLLIFILLLQSLSATNLKFSLKYNNIEINPFVEDIWQYIKPYNNEINLRFSNIYDKLNIQENKIKNLISKIKFPYNLQKNNVETRSFNNEEEYKNFYENFFKNEGKELVNFIFDRVNIIKKTYWTKIDLIYNFFKNFSSLTVFQRLNDNDKYEVILITNKNILPIQGKFFLINQSPDPKNLYHHYHPELKFNVQKLFFESKELLVRYFHILSYYVLGKKYGLDYELPELEIK